MNNKIGAKQSGADADLEPAGASAADQAIATRIGLGLLSATLVATLLMLIAIGQAARGWLTVPFLLTIAATVYLLRTGRQKLGVRFGIAGCWLSAMLGLSLINGIRGPSVSVFAALLLLAGWHIGPRAVVWLTGLTVLALGLLAHAAASGWPYPVTVEATPYYAGLVQSAVMIGAGSVSFFAARALQNQFYELNTSRTELRHKVDLLAARETELNVAQARLLELNSDLEQRVRQRTTQLHETMRELESFSYTVSHDLRSPLRTINGHLTARLEATPRLTADAAVSAGAIGRGVEQMSRIIDGLLRLARVSRGELEIATIDMNEVLERLLEDLKPNYPATQIRVDPLPNAHGDPTLIQQVLANLVSNALKFSARRDQPQVHVGWSESKFAWFVSDNGVGFDMSYASHLFENFTRLHSAHEFDGTGIGLTLVKKIVERHGGRVWADAEPGEGASFYFQLGRDHGGTAC